MSDCGHGNTATADPMTDSEGPLGQFFAGRLICVLAAGSYKKEDWRVSRPLTSWTESMYVDTQGNARLPPYSHKCIHCGNIFTFNNSLKDLRKLMQHHVLPPSSLNVHVVERKSSSIINVDTQVSALFTTTNLWFATLTDSGLGAQVALKSWCITMLMCIAR